MYGAASQTPSESSAFTVAPIATQAAAMILISTLGYTLRRGCKLKWVLVIMTFEGSLRFGMLISLIGMVFFQRRF